MKRGPLESNDTQNSPGPRANAKGELSRERALFAAALLLVTGLALVGTVSSTVGGVVTLASWVYFVVALHRYGRGAR